MDLLSYWIIYGKLETTLELSERKKKRRKYFVKGMEYWPNCVYHAYGLSEGELKSSSSARSSHKGDHPENSIIVHQRMRDEKSERLLFFHFHNLFQAGNNILDFQILFDGSGHK